MREIEGSVPGPRGVKGRLLFHMESVRQERDSEQYDLNVFLERDSESE